MTAANVPDIVAIGIHGYGRSHVETVVRAHHEGRVRLIGVADPVAPEPGTLPDGVAYHEDAAALLSATSPSIAIISTPIHTHADLALAALDAGADVLLEKPPTATLAEFELVRARADSAGKLVQIGFQSLGSTAIGHLRERIAAGAIGDVVRYGASAGWVRDDRYWQRAAWAGRRRLGDRVVADGVLTNPLAHATATALAVAGATGVDDIARVELDLHRANDIESDDTSVARLTLADGRRLTTAVTLCAAQREEPYIEIAGTAGILRFFYSIDVVQEIAGDGAAPWTTRHSRVGLIDNLIAARATGAPLLAPLTATGGFMRLLDGVMAAPDPAPIDPAFVREVSDEAGRHLVLDGIESALRDALRTERTFAELALPWAR